MKQLILLFFILFNTNLFSQSPFEVVEPDYIKTVILQPTKADSYVPIIRLGESFILSFDDLEADQKYYYYKIQHFDFNWQPSGLSEREYIKGYDGDRIRSDENSFNTLQFYTHYSIVFPNRSTQLLLSGNYMISVLDENENIIFTRRLVLYESLVDVGVSVHRSREIATIDTKQNVQFVINHPNMLINNPEVEIKTVLMQNNNWQTAMYNLVPQFYRGSQLLYKYLDITSFWAGNEFLYFDSKAVRLSNVYIKRVDSGPELYHTILYTNDERIDKPYGINPDINGNFVVRNVDGTGDSNIEADYTWVFFSLNTMEDLRGKRIFINGNFNNWRDNVMNELFYNEETGLYEAQILIKQGFYNYQFVTIDTAGNFSNHDIDGSFYQTENDYTVLVYYRKIGDRFDSVIGIGQANSRNILN
ncbi:MAG: DUF5103 domain-containing protein [Urechidicola sp.]|nr:DUF5103 domain-containing protein [Urechidicola sp.]